MIDIVIPFHSNTLRDLMLKYCLRSFCNYLKSNYRVVIMGEPVGFVDNVLVKLYMAGEDTDGDENQLLLHICNDPDISDKFMFLHEWMFLARPAVLNSFRHPVALCPAWQSPGREYEALRAIGVSHRKLYNYEAGVPVVYEKSKLRSVLDMQEEEPFGKLPAATEYFNFWFSGAPRQACAVTARFMGYDGPYSNSSDDSMWVIQQISSLMCITVNTEGFTLPVLEVLDQMFPNPCIFEKNHNHVSSKKDNHYRPHRQAQERKSKRRI